MCCLVIDIVIVVVNHQAYLGWTEASKVAPLTPTPIDVSHAFGAKGETKNAVFDAAIAANSRGRCFNVL